MALMFAICSPQPNWMPRNPNDMFQICQNESRGFSTGGLLLSGSVAGSRPAAGALGDRGEPLPGAPGRGPTRRSATASSRPGGRAGSCAPRPPARARPAAGTIAVSATETKQRPDEVPVDLAAVAAAVGEGARPAPSRPPRPCASCPPPPPSTSPRSCRCRGCRCRRPCSSGSCAAGSRWPARRRRRRTAGSPSPGSRSASRSASTSGVMTPRSSATIGRSPSASRSASKKAAPGPFTQRPSTAVVASPGTSQ